MRLYRETPQNEHAVEWAALYDSALDRLRRALSRVDAADDDTLPARDAPTSALLAECARVDLARAADGFCRIDAAQLYAADDGYTYGPAAVPGLPRHE